MYEIDDLIVYGSIGVCRIEAIGMPDISGIEKEKKYFKIRPMHSKSGVIYAPVDNCKVTMRKLMSMEAAHELIDSIPSIDAIQESNSRILVDKYKGAINTQDCSQLVSIIKTVHRNNHTRTSSGKKIGEIDKRYMKQAENLLYSELSISLNIPKENIEKYVADKILQQKHA